MVEDSLSEYEVLFADSLEELSKEDRESIEAISVFVDVVLERNDLENFPALRYIATRSAGYDHIDIDYAKQKGIKVCRVPHYGARTVAEFAFALMFALSRNAFRSYVDLQENVNISDLSFYEGFDLFGKTIGIVGTGAIGENACEIALGLGMRVLANDLNEKDSLREKGVTYLSLTNLLAKSDIVSLHIPAIPENKHIIDASKLAVMKKSSYLINTSRGEVVDTKALVRALKDKQIAGAGLDVLEGEHDLREEVNLLVKGELNQEEWKTLVANHALIDMPNVIITPHIAFNTREAKREITEVTIKNLECFAEGKIDTNNAVC